MEPTQNNQEKPARGRNIVLNLLVLALLFLMVRSILGWSQPKDPVVYSNFRCNCRITLPGGWVRRQTQASAPQARFEIFRFDNAQFFSNKYIRIFHTNMDLPDEQKVRDWTSGLLESLEAQDTRSDQPVPVGTSGTPAEQFRFSINSWDGRLLYFNVAEDVYAIELTARNWAAAQSDFTEILNAFETTQ